MAGFWQNPELVRHLRAELRATRAIAVAAVVLAVCLLVALACWSSQQQELARAQRAAQQFDNRWTERVQTLEQRYVNLTALLMFEWLVGMEAVALTFWSLVACAQALSGERDRKTWDFQRITRLTSGELLVGKLFGEPILAYFVVLCAVPITMVAGWVGGFPLGRMLVCYAFILEAAMFLGLSGLCLSTLLESRSRGVGLIGALIFYGVILLAYHLRSSGLPGLAALSPLTGILAQFGPDRDDRTGRVYSATLFGHEVSWQLVSLLLYATFGAWLVLILVRNLKRDYEQIRLFSRWQAIGCAAFLNFLIYALLKPSDFGSGNGTSKNVAEFAVITNGYILFVMGLATLAPQERLKIWARKRAAGKASIFSDEGLPWPWLVLSAVVAYTLMVWGTMAWRNELPLEPGTLLLAAVQLLVVVVFVTRDILFIQWCTLTRLRQPVVKGFLYLCLYYATAGVFVLLFSAFSEQLGLRVMSLLTPIGALDSRTHLPQFPSAVYVGIALQVGASASLILAITRRLCRPTRRSDVALAASS